MNFKSLVVVICLMPMSILAQTTFSKEGQRKDPETIQLLKITPFVQGTLQLPKNGKSDKLVIFIMGSGDVDRDGNQATSRRDTFKKMANALAEKGIATFRYDKRIIPMLKQQMDYNRISFNDFIADAQDVITYFSKTNRFQQLYIAGHSQGSLVGILASRESPKVAGLISLAGASQPIDETISQQLEQQMGMGEIAKEAFTKLREQGSVLDYNPALASIFNPDLQPFMLSWLQYNPTAEISKLDIPVLIINGTKDLQVPVEDAKALNAAANTSELLLFENMNHVLVTIEGDDLENTKSYSEAWRPLSEGLVDAIVTFVKTHEVSTKK